jgi:hypothetical protein
MLEIEFPTLNFDLVPVRITSFVITVSLPTKFTPFYVLYCMNMACKMPRHLVAGFISEDKFCLTVIFIGLLLLYYITITTNTTNITGTMKYIGYELDGPGIKSQ